MSCVCHAFASVLCCLVVTWRERANLLALVCDDYCDFVTFPFDILGQVWYLFVSIPDPCCLFYFYYSMHISCALFASIGSPILSSTIMLKRPGDDSNEPNVIKCFIEKRKNGLPCELPNKRRSITFKTAIKRKICHIFVISILPLRQYVSNFFSYLIIERQHLSQSRDECLKKMYLTFDIYVDLFLSTLDRPVYDFSNA